MAAADGDADGLEALCRRLPKAELHAHLHGSLRVETLAELAADAPDGAAVRSVLDGIAQLETRSLADCFRLFDMIHALVADAGALRRAARQVLADFAADGVVYLELRSTPRSTAAMSCEAYLRTVLEEVAAAEAKHGMVVRYLLSFNRANGVAEAAEALRLLEALPPPLRDMVVGVDLSGNPTKGCFQDFVPLLERARAAGLRCTVHCGEVDDAAEVDAILSFGPDRVGHALRLGPDGARRLSTPGPGAVPVECCPSSNCKTLKLRKLKEHPRLGRWLARGYPVAICTDDSGVFETTLSRELALVARAFGLGHAEVRALAARAFDFAFAAPQDVARARERARARGDEARL